MSYKEVELLRKSGNLDDAYQMAKLNLNMAIENEATLGTPGETDEENPETENKPVESPTVVAKRALAWVLYEYLKKNTSQENMDVFMEYLSELKDLQLDSSEKMVVNQTMWLIGKSVFEFTKSPEFDRSKIEDLADITMCLHFSKQNKAYSFLLKSFHKGLKGSPKYIDFVWWWDLKSFIRDDYKYTKQDDGNKIMALVEQTCNRYAKTLIRELDAAPDQQSADKLMKKLEELLPIMDTILRFNKFYRKLPYYRIKVLIALGEYETVYTELKTYAKTKQNEFWVWEMMAEAYANNPKLQLACLSTALLCRAKPAKISEAREKLAEILVAEEEYDRAKTEIAFILRCCFENKWDIPESVSNWGDQPWYGLAKVRENNLDLYHSYRHNIDDIIFDDIPQTKIVVEAVNAPKKILNFLDTELNKGYFKYDKMLNKVEEGDVLLVRIEETDMQGRYNLHHAKKTKDLYVDGLLKNYAGEVIMPEGKPFGFVDGLYITPDTCEKYNLFNGDIITGRALIAYNKKKEEWGWKVISVD